MTRPRFAWRMAATASSSTSPAAGLRAEIRITDLDKEEKATALELLFLRATPAKIRGTA